LTRKLALIGVPSSAGAYAPGQEKAPAAFREAHLLDMLRGRGIAVDDYGDVSHFRWRADRKNPTAMNVEHIFKAAQETAEQIKRALTADAAALVLGGDCTVELGCVSGTAQVGENLGLIYVDLDTDMNTPNTTVSGALDWMGVAHMLGVDGTAQDLAAIGPRFPLLSPDSIYLFAHKNVRPCEQALIDSLGIQGVHADAVAADPEGCARRAAIEWGSKFDRLLIHLDVDVIDFESLPIAENTRRKMGLSFGTAMAALDGLLRAQNWRVLTITEVNPDHGLADGSTIRDFATSLTVALGHAPAIR